MNSLFSFQAWKTGKQDSWPFWRKSKISLSMYGHCFCKNPNFGCKRSKLLVVAQSREVLTSSNINMLFLRIASASKALTFRTTTSHLSPRGCFRRTSMMIMIITEIWGHNHFRNCWWWRPSFPPGSNRTNWRELIYPTTWCLFSLRGWDFCHFLFTKHKSFRCQKWRWWQR